MHSIKYGSIGIFIAIITHVISIMLFFARQNAAGSLALVAGPDLFIWILLCFLFYGLSVAAAQSKYESQREDIDPLNGVRGEGIGTALVICIGNWLFIFIRAFFQDMYGFVILVEPFSLIIMILITIFFAFLFGSAAGNSVENKYRHTDFENF